MCGRKLDGQGWEARRTAAMLENAKILQEQRRKNAIRYYTIIWDKRRPGRTCRGPLGKTRRTGQPNLEDGEAATGCRI